MNILENHSALNKIKTISGLRISKGSHVSAYILECRLKKIFSSLPDKLLYSLSIQKYGEEAVVQQGRHISKEDIDRAIERFSTPVLSSYLKIVEKIGVEKCLRKLLRIKK